MQNPNYNGPQGLNQAVPYSGNYHTSQTVNFKYFVTKHYI